MFPRRQKSERILSEIHSLPARQCLLGAKALRREALMAENLHAGDVAIDFIVPILTVQQTCSVWLHNR